MTMSVDALVREVNEADFAAEVLEASRRRPVLVDFWAPWCGPCRVLGPALERIAGRFADRLRVAKVNVDENPELAARYGVRGIPAVKLFVDGAVADEFVGAQPEGWIADWLTERLLTEADRVAERALVRFAEGAREEAVAMLEEALAKEPEADRARLKLVWMLLEMKELDRAREAFAGLSARARMSDEGERLRSRMEMLARGGDAEALLADARARPEDAAAQLAAADALAAEARYEEAMRHYLEAMRRDRGEVRGKAREGMLRVFQALGGRGELVDRYRREMARVLFS